MKLPVFNEFRKIPRLSRDIVVTEKIDGTNGVIFIPDAVEAADFDYPPIVPGSRSRWLVNGDENHGFARWVYEHQNDLLKLGPGCHYGEWWGKGIQRGYGLAEKRFSLFNTSRWSDPATRPECCHVVPVLYEGVFSEDAIKTALRELDWHGSVAAPGFKSPEGVVIFHTAGNLFFKKTLLKDEKPKGSTE